MLSESQYIELLARHASGEASAQDTTRLEAACAESETRRGRRDAFLAAVNAARADDTVDAPGPTLLRAYSIPTREASVPAVRVSQLQVVFDSLRPAVGLRSGSPAGRQLMLEGDGVTADVFIRGEGKAMEIRVMLEGDRAASATVFFAGPSFEVPFANEGDNEWSMRSPGRRGRIEIRIGGQTMVTEVLELG